MTKLDEGRPGQLEPPADFQPPWLRKTAVGLLIGSVAALGITKGLIFARVSGAAATILALIGLLGFILACLLLGIAGIISALRD